MIQQIKYGKNHDEITINPFLKQIYFPDPILKEISIVDTPGTNTIIEHHQEITERFIPVADLVVFVFEAKNPYRQSAWDFLDRKSTRLNSSHVAISYAVFCLKKKKRQHAN